MDIEDLERLRKEADNLEADGIIEKIKDILGHDSWQTMDCDYRFKEKVGNVPYIIAMRTKEIFGAKRWNDSNNYRSYILFDHTKYKSIQNHSDIFYNLDDQFWKKVREIPKIKGYAQIIDKTTPKTVHLIKNFGD